MRIGFIINPIAGMGGRVGLKGTDGLASRAAALGARPIAFGRAEEFLRAFLARSAHDLALTARWISCTGAMGTDALRAAGVLERDLEIVHEAGVSTTAEDTRAAASEAVLRKADLLVFVGGDGTARDIEEVVRGRVPVLGIPSGVKMHSGVFAVSPEAGADLLVAFLRGELRVGEGELLDVDEEAYRRGEWKVRLHGTARTLVEPNLVQAGKLLFAEVSHDAVIGELVEHFHELFEAEPDVLFLLGPGSTLEAVAKGLGLEKTLLGIDGVAGERTVATDLDERAILKLLEAHPKAKLVVSPIGAQGFILGRGNLQVSPEVVRRLGLRNVLVVATPNKLVSTPVLRVDTGDDALDREFEAKEYWFVIIGYRTTKLHPIKG